MVTPFGQTDAMTPVGQTDAMTPVGQTDVVTPVGQTDAVTPVGQTDAVVPADETDADCYVGVESQEEYDSTRRNCCRRLCNYFCTAPKSRWVLMSDRIF